MLNNWNLLDLVAKNAFKIVWVRFRSLEFVQILSNTKNVICACAFQNLRNLGHWAWAPTAARILYTAHTTSPLSTGQYCSHLRLPCSTRLHNITIDLHFSCQTYITLQKYVSMLACFSDHSPKIFNSSLGRSLRANKSAKTKNHDYK